MLGCNKYGNVNIDVDVKGNSSNIDHLLRKRIGAKGNNSQLGFEVGLRSYGPNSTFKPGQKWSNVMVTNSRNSPLNMCKTEAGIKAEKEASGNLRQSRFTDKYKEKNANMMRHLFHVDQNVSVV